MTEQEFNEFKDRMYCIGTENRNKAIENGTWRPGELSIEEAMYVELCRMEERGECGWQRGPYLTLIRMIIVVAIGITIIGILLKVL